jgi:chemotaxis protein methyltransferase CheR
MNSLTKPPVQSMASPSHSSPAVTRPAPAHGARVPTISDREFEAIRTWIYDAAGINLSAQKKALVMGRLASRLRHFQLDSYGEYFTLLKSGRHKAEPQIAIDLLTTNETHFFREPKHFDFLRNTVLPQHSGRRQFRVWSAASSSGEEPYSIAMTLAAVLGDAPWEVFASDLSSRVLARAASGHYAMARAESIPRAYLTAHCLKGIGAQEGTFVVVPNIRNRVNFSQVNLNRELPAIGEFDVVFLRNVMIYFDVPTKRQVVGRILSCLRPGGYLLIGHSESLNGVVDTVKSIAPSIYLKQ